MSDRTYLPVGECLELPDEPSAPRKPALVADAPAAVTWDELTRHEPELLELAARVQSIRGDAGNWYCANDDYERIVKPGVSRLTGWYAQRNDPYLATPAAYAFAIDYLYDLLPNCRNCGCPTVADLSEDEA